MPEVNVLSAHFQNQFIVLDAMPTEVWLQNMHTQWM